MEPRYRSGFAAFHSGVSCGALSYISGFAAVHSNRAGSAALHSGLCCRTLRHSLGFAALIFCFRCASLLYTGVSAAFHSGFNRGTLRYSGDLHRFLSVSGALNCCTVAAPQLYILVSATVARGTVGIVQCIHPFAVVLARGTVVSLQGFFPT